MVSNVNSPEITCTGEPLKCSELNKLHLIVTNWQHDYWYIRKKAKGCPCAADYYEKAARHLIEAMLALEKAILEDSAETS